MGFLQIPPHGGHPCPWLTVPTAKSVADFHRQVIAHAERTTKTDTLPKWRGIRFIMFSRIDGMFFLARYCPRGFPQTNPLKTHQEDRRSFEGGLIG